jgi:hypothetical protein
MKKVRRVNLEIGSADKYKLKNNKLPDNFLTVLIARYKAGEITPVYKAVEKKNRRCHGLTATNEEWLYLKKEALRKGVKIGDEGATGLIRALINGDTNDLSNI